MAAMIAGSNCITPLSGHACRFGTPHVVQARISRDAQIRLFWIALPVLEAAGGECTG
jgi:hypothetical protein